MLEGDEVNKKRRLKTTLYGQGSPCDQEVDFVEIEKDV